MNIWFYYHKQQPWFVQAYEDLDSVLEELDIAGSLSASRGKKFNDPWWETHQREE